ncbi:hypothetical protein COV61_01805 [Candidatus Micrarchaeota archaeon CG11_big_fil_rev_8_21_14_0_20_47_5]|nr:MAG: hypothetical protein AUJ17_02205 [Candidatus Micrarchaeota archaeon CG1_02_47_40]PIN83884.1 MAG: hypothetical protein COV61_01805 [Candidatus Micrarchaeota archaeon CG11_big_fil_rev_8_21_14_0_20_47_5]
MAKYLDLGLRIFGGCLLLALLLILFVALAPILGVIPESPEANTGQPIAMFINGALPIIVMLLLLLSPLILVLSVWAEIFKAKNDKTWKIIWFAVSLLWFIFPLLGLLGLILYYFIGRKEMKE